MHCLARSAQAVGDAVTADAASNAAGHSDAHALINACLPSSPSVALRLLVFATISMSVTLTK
jgi:hypothetical protein